MARTTSRCFLNLIFLSLCYHVVYIYYYYLYLLYYNRQSQNTAELIVNMDARPVRCSTVGCRGSHSHARGFMQQQSTSNRPSTITFVNYHFHRTQQCAETVIIVAHRRHLPMTSAVTINVTRIRMTTYGWRAFGHIFVHPVETLFQTIFKPILSLRAFAHLTVLSLSNPALNITFSLLPITSSHPHASASDSTFDYWRYINIWLTLTLIDINTHCRSIFWTPSQIFLLFFLLVHQARLGFCFTVNALYKWLTTYLLCYRPLHVFK